jgi:hypothetical protein
MSFSLADIVGGYSSGLILCTIVATVFFRDKLTTWVCLAFFTWLSLMQVTTGWLTDLIPRPGDSFTYFETAKHLALQDFDVLAREQYFRPGIGNLGINLFRAMLGLLYLLGFHTYGLVHFFHLVLTTVAVGLFFRLAVRMYGDRRTGYFFIIVMVGYFELYWGVAHILREPPLLLLLGVALTYWFRWFIEGERSAFGPMLLFAFAGSLFRLELMLPFWITVLGLSTIWRSELTTANAILSLIAVPVLGAMIFRIGLVFLGSDPLKLINMIRAARAEEGHALTHEPVGSYLDLLLQLPRGLLFTFCPISPWEFSTGAMYLRAYAYSLTTLVLLLLGAYGGWRMYQERGLGDRRARGLVVLIGGSLTLASIVGLLDIGVGANARHVVPGFLVIFAFLSAHGADQVYRRLTGEHRS